MRNIQILREVYAHLVDFQESWLSDQRWNREARRMQFDTTTQGPSSI